MSDTDIAQLGFSVNTVPVQKAANDLDKLTPAVDRAERATDRFSKGFSAINATVLKAVAVLENIDRTVTQMAASTGRASAATNALDSGFVSVTASARAYDTVVAKVTMDLNGMTAAVVKSEAAIERQADAHMQAYRAALLHAEAARRAANENVRPPVQQPGQPTRPGASNSSFNVANLAAQGQDIGVTAAMGMNALMIGLQQGTQVAAILSTLEKPLQAVALALRSIFSPLSLLVIASITLIAALIQMVDWSWVAKTALNALADGIELIAPYAAVAAAGLALFYSPAIISGIVNVIALLGRLVAAAIYAAAAMAAANPVGAIIVGLAAAATALVIFRDDVAKIIGIDVVQVVQDTGNYIIGIFVGSYQAVVDQWSSLPTFFSAVGKKAWNSFVSSFEGPSITIDTPWGSLIGPSYNLSGMKSELSAEEEASFTAGSVKFGDALEKDYIGTGLNMVQGAASGAADAIRGLASGIGANTEETKKGSKAASDFAGIVSDSFEKIKSAYESGKSIFQSFVGDIGNSLKQGEFGWQSFAEAGLNALGSIADKILNMASEGVWDWLFSAVTGIAGIGQTGGSYKNGLWGSAIFSAQGNAFNGGTGLSQHRNSIVNKPTMFAFEHGVGVMGEKSGSPGEAILPLSRDSSGDLGVKFTGSNDNGRSIINNDNRVFNITGERDSAEAIASAIRSYDENLPDRVEQINNDPRARTVSV